jgi:hypothetical protein
MLRRRMKITSLEGRAGKFAVFENSIPSDSDLVRITDRNLGIHLVQLPEEVKSLDFLSPVASRLERLVVTDQRVLDVTVLSSFEHLRELDLWATPREEVDLSSLVNLESFAGRYSTLIQSILASAKLTKLVFTRPNDSALRRVSSALKSLRILDCGRLSALPVTGFARSLTELEIAGANEMDVSHLSAYEHLESVMIAEIKALHGVGALLYCPKLREVTFEDCPEIEDFGALSSLTVPKIVRVIGKNPFDSSFREQQIGGGRVRWIFPPGM